jgi:urea carboxylase
MEGPGGYQFVGRTLQMWNRYRQTPDFTRPWLLRFFDQIRFYPVDERELLELREAFPHGGFRVRVEETQFSLSDYERFLAENASGIADFKSRQQAAFEAERERWAAAGQTDLGRGVGEVIDERAEEPALGPHERTVQGHVHGSVWRLAVKPGESVAEGQVLAVLESMKMEIAVHAEHAGRVSRVLCQVGSQVAPGQTLMVIDTLACEVAGENGSANERE